LEQKTELAHPRVVVYGWAAIFIWAFLWAIVLPMSLRGVLSPASVRDIFLMGTIAAAALLHWLFWASNYLLASRSGARNEVGGRRAPLNKKRMLDKPRSEAAEAWGNNPQAGDSLQSGLSCIPG